MRRILLVLFLVMIPLAGLQAQTAPDAAELTALLNDFLAGASRDDAAVHERFWADDLIYTGSAGRRVSKADILREIHAAPAPKPTDPTTVYTAEDVRIHQYGDTAIVAFRLVGTTKMGDRTDVSNYLNTGTFRKQDGKWQAVAWQATRMLRPEDVAEKEVRAAESALQKATREGDVKKLEDLLDEGFVWTLSAGDQKTRKQFLEEMGTGSLKYSRLETSDVQVSLFGETAIVRGKTTRQRSAIPGSSGGDSTPINAAYTFTFVLRDGAWRAVALHTSRHCPEGTK